ncbi:hypothetical protein C8Q80DRAFT_1141460 [Daedaleopsis nitida]|nr:hypothetical protein C8Q80DRAFT_1141460 [Daedaleopsis nitida]
MSNKPHIPAGLDGPRQACPNRGIDALSGPVTPSPRGPSSLALDCYGSKHSVSRNDHIQARRCGRPALFADSSPISHWQDSLAGIRNQRCGLEAGGSVRSHSGDASESGSGDNPVAPEQRACRCQDKGLASASSARFCNAHASERASRPLIHPPRRTHAHLRTSKPFSLVHSQPRASFATIHLAWFSFPPPSPCPSSSRSPAWGSPDLPVPLRPTALHD